MHGQGTRELQNADIIMPFNEQGHLTVRADGKLKTEYGGLLFRYLLSNEAADKSVHDYPGTEFTAESLRLCIQGLGSNITGGTVLRGIMCPCLLLRSIAKHCEQLGEDLPALQGV